MAANASATPTAVIAARRAKAVEAQRVMSQSLAGRLAAG
jgi:hypothetical protein